MTLNTPFGKSGVTTYSEGDQEKIRNLYLGQQVKVKIGLSGYNSYSYCYAIVVAGGWLTGPNRGLGNEKQYASPVLIYSSRPAGNTIYVLALQDSYWTLKSI